MTDELEQSEIDQLLRSLGTGVLSLTDGTDAYGVPESFGYDGESIYFQFVYGEDSQKMEFLETTDTAVLTVYTTDPPQSVVVKGSVKRVSKDDQPLAATAIAENAEIPTLNVNPRVPPKELTFEFYRLVPQEITGRKFQPRAANQSTP